MPNIKLLDEDLINKIAAGEVIERPASIVKELIENSLDAGATNIVIEIKSSGKGLIKITDNGVGMDKEDAKACTIRHATSKISSPDDLFAITTLGFRGEALASIAAVSQLSIITKQADQLEGFNIVVEGGLTISEGLLSSERGTTIEVRNLFFNTPARKKFLKSDPVELRHIIDVVTQYALINFNVGFKLIHEDHALLTSPLLNDWQNNLASIYGATIAKELLPINKATEAIKVTGFISKPHQARNDKHQQSLFVNKRWVKNQDVTKAVYDAYHSLLLVNKHPLFVIHLQLNPKTIDVNVHPQKSEIKIEQKDQIYQTIFTAVKQTLEENNLIPILDFSFEQQTTLQKKETKYAFEPSKQTVFQLEEPEEEYSSGGNSTTAADSSTSSSSSYQDSQLSDKTTDFIKEQQASSLPANPKFPQMKLLGQIHKTFFVAETPGGVLFIDQHVVQERILYERFMQQYLDKKIATQTLLQPELLELTPQQTSYLQANLEKLNQLGFALEPFGQNTFSLTTVPTIFDSTQPKDMVFELLQQLEQNSTAITEKQEEIITRMACHASVRAGDVLTITEMEKMLRELAQCNLPYTCPHGRSIVIKLTTDELDKKFKRK